MSINRRGFIGVLSAGLAALCGVKAAKAVNTTETLKFGEGKPYEKTVRVVENVEFTGTDMVVTYSDIPVVMFGANHTIWQFSTTNGISEIT